MYGDLDIAGMDIREPKQNLALYVHCPVFGRYAVTDRLDIPFRLPTKK